MHPTPTTCALQAPVAPAGGEELAAPTRHLSVDQLVGLFPVLQARPPRIVDYPTAWRDLEIQLASQYSRASIVRALKRHTTSPEYLAAVQEGAPIHDLSGNVVGEVTAAFAAWAKEQATSTFISRKARRVPPTLQMLSERFPSMFNLHKPEPLPPGTYKLLLKRLAGACAPSDLAAALHHYCHVVRLAHSQKPEVVAARREQTTALAGETGTVQKPNLSFRLLKARYPACFDAAPPRPLAHSVVPSLETQLRPEFSRKSFRSVLRTHTLSPGYLQVLVDGAPRYNLAGEIEGVVSVEEAQEAASLLADHVFSAPFVLSMREDEPLGPQGREKLLAALEDGELSCEDFAKRYKVPPATVIAQRNLALRERRLESQAQRKLAEDYGSSGLSEHMFCTRNGIKLKVLRKAIESVEAEKITAALAASIAAQRHAPLALHDSGGHAPPRHQPQEVPPAITVRRRRRIVAGELSVQTSATAAARS